jgi:hypothetical protein
VLHNREFLFGLGSMGVAQFAWALAGAVFFPSPSPWVLGTVPGLVLAGVAVVVGTALAVGRRDASITFGKSWLWALTGVYAGMVLTVLLSGRGGGLKVILLAVLFGLGVLLPPIAVGAVAGAAARRWLAPSSRDA